MRKLAVGLVVGMAALVFGGAASAAPTVSLIWTGTSGSGATGGSVISALAGDFVTLSMSVIPDINGVSGAFLSLDWDRLQFDGLAAIECPNSTSSPTGGNTPPGFSPTSCTPAGGPLMTPFVPGVTIYNLGALSGSARLFDAAAPPLGFTSGTIELGAIDFLVQGAGPVNVLHHAGTAVTDGTFASFFPTATAVVVPEPGTSALLVMGLGLLGFARRRA